MKLPLVFLSASLFGSLCVSGAEADLQVRTRAGILEGKEQGSVRAFLGVPYAAAPVGDLRWSPPVPAAGWEGVRMAREFGPRPMQPAVYKDMVFRDPGCSEDCLSLNIWTPSKDGKAKLPVMVWVFGGGFLAVRPNVVNLKKFEGNGIYYAATFMESQLCGGDEVVVIGGGNSAGQAAVFLAETAKNVYMLVRGKTLSETMSRYLTQRITTHPKIELHLETELVSLEGASHLERVTWLYGSVRAENGARYPARFRDGGRIAA